MIGCSNDVSLMSFSFAPQTSHARSHSECCPRTKLTLDKFHESPEKRTFHYMFSVVLFHSSGLTVEINVYKFNNMIEDMTNIYHL